jgi:CRISPR-associated protein Cas1
VPITPRLGVVTLYGYGINVRVDRGHLLIQDGIGAERRAARLPRVGHGLRRLIVIGSDGMISLSALRWLADQDAAFVMLERDGSVLATTGPVRPSDARLRRAQALAGGSEVALRLARELVSKKLLAQEHVARGKLLDSTTGDTIVQFRGAVEAAETISAIRLLESQGAAAYWAAWQALPVIFPNADLPRVPEHWRTFGSRTSILSGSPRLAVNPPNAILNYLYSVLESESRLAAAALGLDPGLGFIHVDTPARDSLACDLMEPVRPQVDSYVLDWITRQPLRRDWFFEQRDGNCRLMASLAVRLAETAPTWGRAVAPFAEWIARILWTGSKKQPREAAPPTRLTGRRRSEGRGHEYQPAAATLQRPQTICRGCGADIPQESTHCRKCHNAVSREHMIDIARAGRALALAPEARAKRSETQRRHMLAKSAWKPSNNPAWLTEQKYTQEIQPSLAAFSQRGIAAALGVTPMYASHIRRGIRRPHPRHWLALARLVGVDEG